MGSGARRSRVYVDTPQVVRKPQTSVLESPNEKGVSSERKVRLSLKMPRKGTGTIMEGCRAVSLKRTSMPLNADASQ